MVEGRARILIVGCGEVGSRHLQAIATLPEVGAIDVVDPRPDALALGRRRLEEVSDRAPDQRVRWLRSVGEAAPDGALAVIATHADVRPDLVREVDARLGYTRFLLEKTVAQSVADYETLSAYIAQRGLTVWANFKTRVHVSHQRAKASLHPADPIVLSVVGGNHGLANNGIHAADLFAFYARTDRIDAAGASIDPYLHASKRGPELFDLSGTLHATAPNGSRLFISLAADHMAPMCVTLVSRGYRAVIDDLALVHVESVGEGTQPWTRVPFEADLRMSWMNRALITDILTSGSCALPSLAECFPAHRYILDTLRPHFARLLGREIDRCPVT